MMNSSDESDDDYEQRRQTILQLTTAISYAAGAAALAYSLPLYNKTPYHTSALTGADWVRELLNGHPERIRCELGVHKEVFHSLVMALQEGGLGSSRHVFLEEQLAIFLYTCVTGLSFRHVGERFQRSNETISK
jgi:hypothetical protein